METSSFGDARLSTPRFWLDGQCRYVRRQNPFAKYGRFEGTPMGFSEHMTALAGEPSTVNRAEAS